MSAGGVLHRELWDGNRDLAEACLGHPFVRGLGDGTLPAAAFRRYVAQDAFFLRAFLRAYALAAARAERLETAARFHRLGGGVLDELALHAGYAGRLGIDLDAVRPYPATSAYTDFLLATAWTRPAGEIAAAMTPCMRLYALLGQRLAGERRPETAYGEWIDTYASAGFEELAAELEALLDELATDGPEVRRAYRYALECELAFFGAPLEEPPDRDADT